MEEQVVIDIRINRLIQLPSTVVMTQKCSVDKKLSE
jgi:hypothetical protein